MRWAARQDFGRKQFRDTEQLEFYCVAPRRRRRVDKAESTAEILTVVA